MTWAAVNVIRCRWTLGPETYPVQVHKFAVVRTQHAFLHYWSLFLRNLFWRSRGADRVTFKCLCHYSQCETPGLMDFRAKQDIQQENKCKQVLFLSSGN